MEHRVTLNEAVRQHQCLVVLGDPGSGKSTLLRYLALTFAQGKTQVQERLDMDEDCLPILVPLSAFAEARKDQPNLPLAGFLPRYFSDQGLPDFSPLFEETLHSGCALILLDGLDEMLTHEDRALGARAVAEFAKTYPKCRVIVTSRIAGYAPGMLPASFVTFTLAPFDDDAIRRFAQQWSLAFEAIGLSTPALPPDAHRRAMLRADQLATAVTSHPGVRRLATNPLLLTLLALIHHQGTRLPHRRVELYRLCVEALAETWNLARSLTGRPIDLRLGERRMDETFVVNILAPVAYWMHETEPTGLVERDELETRIAEQFVEREGASHDEAASLARDFVDLAREQMGLLVERAPDAFSFLHLSVQEYLAARFLSGCVDSFERLKPRLHNPRWREVILLTAGCLHGDFANTFVENILNAHSPYDDLLHRDVLLAARCVGDDVPVSPKLRNQIRDTLFDLWRHPPFSRLYSEISTAFAYLKGSVIGPDVLNFVLSVARDEGDNILVRMGGTILGLVVGDEERVAERILSVVQDKGHDVVVRRGTAIIMLGLVVGREERVVKRLLSILQDKGDDVVVRKGVAIALGQVGQDEERIIKRLLSVVQDKGEHEEVRMGAAIALGGVRRDEERIVKTLLKVVQDKGDGVMVRRGAAEALGQVGQDEERIIKRLLSVVQDKGEHEEVRRGAAIALGRVGRDEERIVKTLLKVVQDKGDDVMVRRDAAEALGQVARGEEWAINTLLKVVQNKGDDVMVRRGAAEALGQVARGEERIVNTLLKVVQNKGEDVEVRGGTTEALGQVARGEERAVKTLLSVVEDKDDDVVVRRGAAEALGQAGRGETDVAKVLLQVGDEPGLRDAALGALWDVLTQGEGGSYVPFLTIRFGDIESRL